MQHTVLQCWTECKSSTALHHSLQCSELKWAIVRLALFDMPNSNRYNILSISIFCKIPLSISIYSRKSISISISISIFSRMTMSISISISIFFKLSLSISIPISIFSKFLYRYRYRYRYFQKLLIDILSISIFSQKTSIFYRYFKKCRYIDNRYRYFIKKAWKKS